MEAAVRIMPAWARDRSHARERARGLGGLLVGQNGHDTVGAAVWSDREELTRGPPRAGDLGEREHRLELPERIGASARLVEEQDA